MDHLEADMVNLKINMDHKECDLGNLKFFVKGAKGEIGESQSDMDTQELDLEVH